jgi:hypothetical protein
LDILTEIYKLLDKNVVHVRTLDGEWQYDYIVLDYP